jgi:transposase
MKPKRFPEEFKIKAVRQIVERGHPVLEVSARLGVSTHSLYKWVKELQLSPGQRQEQHSQGEELRRLRAELKRVTEERDILKKAAAYFAKQSG